LFLLALVIVVVVMVFALKGKEPSYHGKSLTHWLQDLDDGIPPDERERAEKAVASIGIKALPILDRMLNAKEPSAERIIERIYSLPLVEPTNSTFSVSSARDKHQQVLRAYGVLGTGAIPSLIRALNHEDGWISDSAASCLAELGGRAVDAVPALIRSVERRRDMSVVRALGKIGSGAKEAVPALIEAMRDGDLHYRICVANALIQIDPRLKATNPALDEVLTEGENLARQQGIRATP
jgi:HEAT repeat protein